MSMRIGFNPLKKAPLENLSYTHHVVIPVCIPEHSGYFRDSFNILKICLDSLTRTSQMDTFITIVDNGSTSQVQEYLTFLLSSGSIHELITSPPIGKLNAILKGLAGYNFPIVTISDADVYFKRGWQEETYKIFNAFPKAGAVCPAPYPKRIRHLTFNIIFDFLFSQKLKFTKVKDPSCIENFAASVGDVVKDVHLRKYLTLTHREVRAVVGAGHFVCTYRREALGNFNPTLAGVRIGGDLLTKCLDEPVVRNGFYRLSTEKGCAYHMGNVKEEWMTTEIEPNEDICINRTELVLTPYVKDSKILWWVKNSIFRRIIYSSRVWKYFLRSKGLSPDEVTNF